ncbi:hypothetical protein GCM10028801_35140 [Nocardioides maradonensis]
MSNEGGTSAGSGEWRKALLGSQIEFAQSRLRKTGNLAPFGAKAVAPEGEIVLIAADATLTANEQLDVMLEGVREERDRLLGAAFTCDVRLTDGSDAIRIQYEDSSGQARQMLIPYRRTRLPRSLTLMKQQWSPAEWCTRA